MASPLTLVLISTVLCTGGVTVKGDLAPFHFSEASNTYQYFHHLSCPRDRIVFIWYLENGYKQGECQCDKDQHCCQPAYNDCLQHMSPDILQQVTLECWDKRECRPLVTKPKDSCQEYGVEFQWPTYSTASYFCLPGDTVVDMAKQTSVSGAELTARALPAGLPHSHTVTCSVQTVEGGQQTVGVSTVLSQGAPPLSTLSVGTRTLDSQDRSYTFFDAMTPFHISLQQPAHSSLHYAWIRMEGTGSQWMHLTDAVTREPLTSESSDGGTSTSVPVSSSSGGREQLESDTEDTMLPGTVSEAAKTNIVTSSTFRTDAVTTDLVTSQSNNGGTSTSVPVSTSGGGREQRESSTEDTILPGKDGPTMETVVGLTAGLVVALAASGVIVFLVWRRRQRARGTGHGTQPDQGGRILLAELATARPDVTYEPLRTEGGYQRLVLPGGVGAPPLDVISAGHHDYDECDVVDVAEVDSNDVSRVEEAPYIVILPPDVNEDVTSSGQDDYDDCDVVDITEEDPDDVSRVEREGQIAEEAPYIVILPPDVNDDFTSAGQDDYDDCDVVDVTGENPNDVSREDREGQIAEEAPFIVILPPYVNEDVTSAGQDDYNDCDVVDVTEEDPNDVSRFDREGHGVEETLYDVKEPSYVNEYVTSVGLDCDDCDVVDVTEEDPNDVSRVERDFQEVEESPYDVKEPSQVKEDVD